LAWNEGPDVGPERSEEELRDLVAAKVGRLRMRRRVGVAGGAVLLVAALLAVVAAPDGGRKPNQLRVADAPDSTSTTAESPVDEAIDPSASSTTELAPSTTVRPVVVPRTTTTLPWQKAAACGQAVHSGAGTASPQELANAVTGVWELCQPPGLFGSNDAGIEFRSDGRWSMLVRSASGSLLRDVGWDREGTWSATTGSELSMPAEGGGGAVSPVDFSSGRAKMRLSYTGVFNPEYVRVPAGTAVGDVSRTGNDECTWPEGGVRPPSSTAEFTTAITHAWLLCRAPSVFSSEEAGLEIRSDGRWSKLLRRADGSLVRATGTGNEGTWNLRDDTPNIVYMDIDGGGGIAAHTSLAVRTTKVRLNNNGVWMANYVQAPAGTVVVSG
jgi:hypothetical protein